MILITSNILQTYLNRLILEDRDRQIDEVRRKYENDEDRSQEEVMRIEQETVSDRKYEDQPVLVEILESIRPISAYYQMHIILYSPSYLPV